MDDAKLEIALAKEYAKSLDEWKSPQYAYVIADLCDSYLDRSGGLLGRVSKLADKFHKENKIESLTRQIEKLEEEKKKLGF